MTGTGVASGSSVAEGSDVGVGAIVAVGTSVAVGYIETRRIGSAHLLMLQPKTSAKQKQLR